MTSAPVALISGGSKGLGQGIAEDVLARGGSVAAFSRSPTPFVRAQAEKTPDRFVWAPIDGADAAAASRFAKEMAHRFGRIDVLVNNAGYLSEQLLALTRLEEIHQTIAINLELAVVLAQTCARVMLVQRSGVIINVSSLNSIRGHAGVAAYSATKAGLDGLTRSLARELGPSGIRVNSLAPGYFDSDMASTAIGPKEKARILRRTPLGRFGEVKDMVAVARFLMSDDASFVTGQTLVVDGGITC